MILFINTWAHVIHVGKTIRTAYTKVFTVVLSTWHNSGYLDFLLSIFGDHILFLYWKSDQRFLKRHVTSQKAA